MIGIEHTGFTGLGTGTTKTQLGGADVVLPAWAKSVLAILPNVTIDVPTAAESVITNCVLESDDFPVSPFEVLNAPIGAVLGATTGTFAAKTEKYAVGAPCKGGDRLRVYGTALVANTAAPTMGCGVVVSDMMPGHKPQHAKLGTLTSSGTTATSDVAGTAYQFVGGRRIKELIGVFGHTTVAAASAVNGYIKYSSSEFIQSTPLKLPLNPISAGLSTLVPTFIDGVSRAQVDVPISSPTRIQDYLYMGLAPTVAGNFVSGVVYE